MISLTERTAYVAMWMLAGLLCMPRPLGGQAVEVAQSPQQLVSDAVRYQLDDMPHKGWALRYRVHRVDSKEDSVRDLIESSDGNVARTVERNGKPLSVEDDRAEQQRLRSFSTGEAPKRHRGSDASDRYGTELVGAMPDAMTYTLAPDQPQLSNFNTAQVVLDFMPRPGFKPATTAQSLLTGLAGRMWIDKDTHHLLRVDLRITQNLNLALGLLARVYQGGTLSYEQHPVGGGHYAYTHIDIHVVLRELMVKTVPYHSMLDVTEVSMLPTVPTRAQAVELLLTDSPAKHP